MPEKNPTLEERVEHLEHRFAAHPPSVIFGKLPMKDTRGRVWPLFLLARAHHVQNPGLEEDDGWACIYDEQEAFCWALPRAMIPEHSVAVPYETIDERIKELTKRIAKEARDVGPELGRIEVVRRQGRIFIKHTGVVPVADQGGFAQGPS